MPWHMLYHIIARYVYYYSTKLCSDSHDVLFIKLLAHLRPTNVSPIHDFDFGNTTLGDDSQTAA